MLFPPESAPSLTTFCVRTGERAMAGEECRAAASSRQSSIPEKLLQGLLYSPCVQVHPLCLPQQANFTFAKNAGMFRPHAVLQDLLPCTPLSRRGTVAEFSANL
jgi:hypothetical protein